MHNMYLDYLLIPKIKEASYGKETQRATEASRIGQSQDNSSISKENNCNQLKNIKYILIHESTMIY